MRLLSGLVVAVLVLGCSNPDERPEGEIRGLEAAGSQESTAKGGDPEILAALKAVPDLAKYDFKFLELTVEGDFALATLEAVGKNLDPLTTLVKREEGKWKVVDYGTRIGDPREFGVPDATAERWGY